MLWVYTINQVPTDYYEFDGYVYLITSPIIIGLSNVLSLFLLKKFNLSLKSRILLISSINTLFTIFIVYYYKIYNWKKNSIKSNTYPFKLFIANLITYYIVIYILERAIKV